MDLMSLLFLVKILSVILPPAPIHDLLYPPHEMGGNKTLVGVPEYIMIHCHHHITCTGLKKKLHIPEADGASPEQRAMKLQAIDYPMCGLPLFQKESQIKDQSQRLGDTLGEDLVQTQSAHCLKGSGL